MTEIETNTVTENLTDEQLLANIDKQYSNTTPESQEVTEKVDSTETVKEEPKKEEVVEEKKNKVELKNARHFAEIAKRERELTLKERSIKENISKVESYESARKVAKENPIKFLMDVTGESYEWCLNNYITNIDEAKKTPDPYQKVEERLAKIEKEKEENERIRQEVSKDAWKKPHLEVVSAYVTQNSEEYEAIILHPQRATELYMDLVDQSIAKVGRDLDSNEVIALLKRTDELLTNEDNAHLERLSKSKKFANRFSTSEIKKTVPENKEHVNSPKTNQSTNTSDGDEMPKGLSDEEQLQWIQKRFG